MSIRIETEKNSIERAAELLEGVPNGFQTALSRALNRALQEGRTEGVRAVTKQYTVKARDVRPTFRMQRATKNDLDAELSSRGANLELTKFSHRPQTDTTGNKRKQVRVGVKKGGLKPLGQAFVYNGRIFQRLGAARLPVQLKFGNAVPVMLDNDKVVDKIVDTMGKSVDKRITHETERLLSGAVK